MPRKNPGKNQRKMTEFLTKPDPLSVPEYLRAHPYQEGLRYLKALRKGCQIVRYAFVKFCTDLVGFY